MKCIIICLTVLGHIIGDSQHWMTDFWHCLKILFVFFQPKYDTYMCQNRVFYILQGGRLYCVKRFYFCREKLNPFYICFHFTWNSTDIHISICFCCLIVYLFIYLIVCLNITVICFMYLFYTFIFNPLLHRGEGITGMASVCLPCPLHNFFKLKIFWNNLAQMVSMRRCAERNNRVATPKVTT